MSMGVRSWRFSSSSTPNINEASRLHKNVLPWSVWRGHEDGKEGASPSLRRVTQSGRAECSAHSRASNLFRTASVPDVVADSGNPETAFSSITISARKVAQSGSILHPETFCLSRATGPMRALAPPEPFRSRAFSGMQSTKCVVSQPSMKGSMCAMRASVSQPDLCRQVTTITRAQEFNQGSSTCDRVTMRGQRNKRMQTLEHRHSFTEGDRNQDSLGDLTLSASRSYCSRIDLQVPLRSSSTVVFLDKSLSLSLVELEGRRTTRPALHTSTLSVRLHGSSCQELSTDNKAAQTDRGYRRTKASTGGGNKRADPENSLSKQKGHKFEKTSLAHGVNSEADDSDMRSHGTPWRSPLLRGPSCTEATRRNENSDEAARSTQSNFSCRHRTSSMSPVNSQTWGRQTLSETKEHQQGDGSSSTRDALMTSHRETTCYHSHQLDPLDVTHRRTLSLKEALELFRPDFISRSQGRVRRLEQKTRRRRALQDSNLDLTQGLREDGCSRRRNCTTPHPLSDNLFRPRERSISGREMQLRSKRIYNKLPEVTNKKKEERKRVVSQTNRLRAEVFKKKLLGQVLQR